MRFARGMAGLGLATIACVAITASPASAQVEATVEGGAHCGDLVADGTHAYTNDCRLTAENVGYIEYRALFGIMYLCDTVAAANIDENGEGWIYHQTLTVPGTADPCGLQPCKESGGSVDPWPFELTSETAAELTMCITGAFGIIVGCHMNALPFIQDTHDRAELKTANTTHQFCELNQTDAWMWHLAVTAEDPGVIIE